MPKRRLNESVYNRGELSIAMADLYLAIAVNLSLAGVLGLVAYRVARCRALAIVLASVCIVLLGMNLWKWRDSLWAAHLVPFANMMFLADLTPPLVGVLCGLAARSIPGHPARRVALLVPLCGLCVWGSYSPLWQRPTDLGRRDIWQRGVCRQATDSTCTPAAAATLLAARRVRATQTEMAHLCLTTPRGTRMRGLYRGLKVKTAGTRFTVKPFHATVADLPKALAEGPLLLTVRLEPDKTTDPRFAQEWGWTPGVSHHVVVFRQSADGRFEVGDPAVGREYWDERAFHNLWHGEGVQLVER